MLCVQVTALAGLTVLLGSLTNWESPDLLKYGAFLTVAIFSSGAVIDAPSITGPFSLTFLFVLFGTLELTKPETALLSALMTLAHCWTQSPRVRPAFTIFQAGTATVSAAFAHGVYHASWLTAHDADPAVRLAVATLALFLLNSVPSSLILALDNRSTFVEEWRIN